MNRTIPIGRLPTSVMSGTMLDCPTDSLSLSVIDALADELDTDPVELEPLYNVIDPEALDRLFQDGTPANVRLEFAYGDHRVEVRGDGTILVDGTVHERP